MARQVAVLCARADSVYKTLPCDAFDASRNAWSFLGGSAVCVHPPCRLFGRLSSFAKGTETECAQEIALGMWCARQVQECGGVLEHPAGSALWRYCNLPKPGQQGDGFTMAVCQSWWGHSAEKPTWLYFSGIERRALPALPFHLEAEWAGQAKSRPGSVEWLSKKEREATPPDMAAWLLEAASRTTARRWARSSAPGLGHISTSRTR